MARLVAPGVADVVERRLTPVPEQPLPTDPVAWVRDELGEHLWSLQRKVLRSVVTNRETLVPACHGPGKSFIGSRAAAYWLASKPLGDAFVVSSAPTQKQVQNILWRELARAKRKGALPGRITLDAEWWMGPRGAEEIVAFGRKPQDLTNHAEAMQAFQGIHQLYVLVILDEATGIPKWLWDAAESLMTNENARLLAIGNPDDPASEFVERCQPGTKANVIRISAYDTPAFTGERVPEHLAQLLVSKLWVEERLEKWGEDSPLYQSKVLAVAPDMTDDTVISPALVTKAWDTDLPGTGPGAYGLDVARFGRDKTTLYRVRDGVARYVDSWGKASTHTTRLRVEAHVGAHRYVPTVIDADGIGGGVFDEMRGHHWKVIPFSVNTAAHEPHRYFDRRSEVWWEYRLLMEQGLVDLDRDDLDLAAQLQQPKWRMQGARIRVESKDEMRKRGLPSPDRADAVIMATLAAPHVRLGERYPDGNTNGGAAKVEKPLTAGLKERLM